MIGPKEKKERALGEHLHLKGERCNSPKCAMIRKPYKPGVHGPRGRRKNLSDFGRQLQEKQKFKLVYGIDERGLLRLFIQAQKRKGSTAAEFLRLLELRLDNVLYRLGLASSRTVARQLVVHGHILVNKKRVRSPGYQVRVNDVIAIRPESQSHKNFEPLKETLKKYEVPSWLLLNADAKEGKVLSLPDQIESPFEINLLVESFSK